jgi:hypothetical protein
MPYVAFPHDTSVVTKPTLDNLRELAANKPPSVTIFEYPFDSLKPLAVLAGVEVLKIQDSGALRTLDGAAALAGVKNLVISTPPTWDGTSRKIEIDSFKPLTALTSLERLILQSVRPNDLDLSSIAQMTHLKDVDIGGVPEFTIEHYARLAAALPNAEGRCLQPYFEIKNLAFCKKCKAGMVMLNGTPPRARKWMCPKCNEKKLAAHVRTWESFAKTTP